MSNRSLTTRILCIALVAIAVFFAWTRSLDASAEASVDAGLKRALTSFAVARTLNAVISVARGTEVAVQPAGVGVILAPGQLLAPADQLIEQFGSLMFAATVAFGVMKLLIALGQQALFAWLLTALALLWAVLLLSGRGPSKAVSLLLTGLLFARFAMPLSTLSSDWVFEQVMKPGYESSQQLMTNSAPRIQAAAERKADGATPIEKTPAPDGMVERLGKWLPIPSIPDPTAKFNQLRAMAEGLAEHTVHLVVVFLMQTLVIPLLTLWALKQVAWTSYRAVTTRRETID